MRALIYTRVSSAEQLREGFSITAQEIALRRYCELNDLEIVEHFTADESGGEQKARGEFKRMVAYLRTHPDVRTVVVEKVDRLYRNMRDFIAMKDLRVTIHFPKDGMIVGPDSRSKDNLNHNIRLVLAENFLENLSEEVKKGMQRKCEEGGWPTWAPLGYLNVKETAEKKRTGGIVLDPVKAPLVRELFEAAAGRHQSLGSLVKLADKIGLRGRQGVKLGKGQLVNMFRCTAYYGVFRWSGKEYRGKYEPLLDRDLFERAVRAMREGSRPKAGARTFAYSGIVRCTACGGLLTGDLKKGRYIYYACRGKAGCQRYVPEERFDRAMTGVLRSLTLPPETRDLILSDIAAWYDSTTKKGAARATRLRTRLTEIARLSVAAYEEKLLGRLTEAMWRDVSARWRDEERRLRSDLATVQPSVDQETLLRKSREPFELLETVSAQYLERNPADRAEIVHTICERVLFDGVSVSIQLKSPFDVLAKFEQNRQWLARATWCENPLITEFVAAILPLAA
jgi:site-specific DNA recombinase